MNENDKYLSRSRKQKKKKKNGCLRWFIVVMLIVLAIFGYGFLRLKQTTNRIHDNVVEEKETHASRVEKDLDLDGKNSFSVLMLGIDTGDMGRVEQGRSDTMMVMVVNPESNKTTLLSIPRDTYTEISGKGIMDKINHAYAFGGAAMSMNTVQNMLDIPIDYYASVNMEGIQQIVNAVDGVTITPEISFNQSGYSFVEGQTMTMDGAQALAYSRMRKQDPSGDYGRQSRQRAIVEAIVDEALSINSVFNYQSILKTMEDNVKTNLTFNQMVNISLNYSKPLKNFEEIQMSGTGTKMNGIYYDIMADEEIERVSNILKTELGTNE